MNDVSPGKITLMAGAAVTFIFSFLPWYSAKGFGFKFSANAWQSGMLPIATWAPVLAIVAGFAVAAKAFKFLELPEKIWEFTVDQLVLIFSVFTLIITVSYLIMDHGGASIGFGLILCLIGSVAMVAGFFMDKAGIGVNPNATPGGDPAQAGFPQTGQAPPAPGGFQPPPQQTQPAPPQQPPAQPQQDPGSF